MLVEVVVIVWVEDQLIPFELWTVALDTYFWEFGKIVKNSLMHQ